MSQLFISRMPKMRAIPQYFTEIYPDNSITLVLVDPFGCYLISSSCCIIGKNTQINPTANSSRFIIKTHNHVTVSNKISKLFALRAIHLSAEKSVTIIINIAN